MHIFLQINANTRGYMRTAINKFIEKWIDESKEITYQDIFCKVLEGRCSQRPFN